MKKILILLILINLFIIVPGCSDYNEINDFLLITGLAVDKSQDDVGFLITAEFVDLRGATKEAKLQSKRIESQGKTIQDAIRNIIKISGKKLYSSHLAIVIISQDVAKEGVLNIFDIITRNYQTRLTINILISKEKTAKELLSEQSMTTDIRSIEIKRMIHSEKDLLSISPHIDIRQYINDLMGDGISATLPMIGLISNGAKKTSELSGTAIFKEDKYIGALDENETKYLLFVKNNMKTTVIPLKKIKDINKEITVLILSNKTKIKPVYKNDKLSMNIDIQTKFIINELGIDINLLDTKSIDKIERETEKNIKENIEKLINKVTAEFNSDIFGFGKIVKREKPDLCKKIAHDWNDIFKNITVNVNVKSELKGSGLSSKPIKIGD